MRRAEWPVQQPGFCASFLLTSDLVFNSAHPFVGAIWACNRLESCHVLSQAFSVLLSKCNCNEASEQPDKEALLSGKPPWLQATQADSLFQKEGIYWKETGGYNVSDDSCSSGDWPYVNCQKAGTQGCGKGQGRSEPPRARQQGRSRSWLPL